MIISDITATWWHHLVFKYHPIETTRFFIIWLEVNGTLPRCPCIGTVHQVSAVLRISEPYLQLCHLMQNTAVAAQITRTLQHMMGNLHSPELMVYCLLCVLLSDNILVPFSYEETVKLCKCKMFLAAEMLFKVCNPSILSSSWLLRTLLPPLSWQCHSNDRDMSEPTPSHLGQTLLHLESGIPSCKLNDPQHVQWMGHCPRGSLCI